MGMNLNGGHEANWAREDQARLGFFLRSIESAITSHGKLRVRGGDLLEQEPEEARRGYGTFQFRVPDKIVFAAIYGND